MKRTALGALFGTALLAVLAALLCAVLAPAPGLAGEWLYHGGPRSPDSQNWYAPEFGGPYGYGTHQIGRYFAEPYVAKPAYGWDAPPDRFRCGPATVDCYNGRQLQRTR